MNANTIRLQFNKQNIVIGALLVAALSELKHLWKAGITWDNVLKCVPKLLLPLGGILALSDEANVRKLESMIEESKKYVLDYFRDQKFDNTYVDLSGGDVQIIDCYACTFNDQARDLDTWYRFPVIPVNPHETVHKHFRKFGRDSQVSKIRLFIDRGSVYIKLQTAEETGLSELIEKLGKSKFKSTIVSLLLSLKFSALFAMMSEKLNFSENVKMIMSICEGAIASGQIFTDLKDIGELFATEILPAVITGDYSKISETHYTSKLQQIHRALAISKKADLDEMDKFIAEWMGDKPTCQLHRVAAFLAVLTEIQELVINRSNSHMLSNVSQLTATLQDEMVKWTRELKAIGERFTPYCIGLWGDAGTGKSSFMEVITLLLARPLGLRTFVTKDELGREIVKVYKIVNVSDGNTFMDNINSSTEVISFDDMGITRKEFIAKTNSALSIFMQVQGSNLYLIPRSDLPNKIGQFFCNKLTFVTSNVRDYGADTVIADMEAFRRRIHVDIHVVFNNPQNKQMYDRTFKASYIDFRTYARSTKTYTSSTPEESEIMLKELYDDIEKHCEQYVIWKQQSVTALKQGLCPNCKRLLARCVCREMVNDDDSDAPILLPRGREFHSESASGPIHIVRRPFEILSAPDRPTGMWVVPNTTMQPEDVVRQVVFEELVLWIFLFSLRFVLTTLLWSYNYTIFFMFISNMIFREFMEINCGKHLVFTRMLYMGILCNPDFFFVNIVAHLFFNYTMLTEPLIARATERININIDLAIAQFRYRMTPQWIHNLNPLLDLNFIKTQSKDYIYNNRSAIYKFAIAAGLTLALKKFVWDDDYEETNLGEPAKEEDIAASNELDAMIGGTPEVSLDGLSKDNAWKSKPLVLNKKVSDSIPKSLRSNILQMNIQYKTGNVVDTIKFEGSWSEGRVFTCRHVLNGHHNAIINFNFKGDTKVYSYSYCKDSPVISHIGDTISFPFIPPQSRPTLKVSMDYDFQAGDEVMIGDHEFCKKCRYDTTKCTCGCKETANPVAIAVKSDNDFGDGVTVIVFDAKTHLGVSGSPVYILKRNGISIERRLVGIATGRHKSSHNAVVQLISKRLYNPPPILEQVEKTSDRTFLMYQQTPEEVREKFKRYYGITVTPAVSTYSTLRHLQRDENGDIVNNLGEFVGSFNKAPPSTETKFYKTKFYEQAQAYEAGKFVIPNLKTEVKDGVYRNPLLACVRQMNSIGQIEDEAPFWSAATRLFNYLKVNLDLTTWTPYSLHEAIVGDEYTTALNRKASKGFPFTGQKDEWICGDFEKAYLKMEPAKLITEIIKDMDKGVVPLNISVAALKDEIVSKAKDDAGKIRVFFAGNFSYLILCRMYLGKFLNLFTANRMKLFPKIGLNALGKEFHDMVEFMFKLIYGDDEEWIKKQVFLDGDFSAYDKLLLVLRYAITVVWWLACESPYFSKHKVELLRLHKILVAMMEYIVIIGEDIFIMRDRIPSGLWGTAIINCLCECIIEILQFYYLLHLYHCSKTTLRRLDFVAYYKDDFFVSVALSNFGDDNLKCVGSAYLKIYTHENIMKFAAWIRIPITPARKHETRVELKAITDCLFLKRVFVWNEHCGRLVGRLEMSSIGKMLAFSDTEEHALWETAVIMTAERELALHGREILESFYTNFNLIPKVYEDVLDSLDSGDSMLPSLKRTFDTIDDDDFEIERTASVTREQLESWWRDHGILLAIVPLMAIIMYVSNQEVDQHMVDYDQVTDYQRQWLDQWNSYTSPFGIYYRIVYAIVYGIQDRLALIAYPIRFFYTVKFPNTPSGRLSVKQFSIFTTGFAPIYEELFKHIHVVCGYLFILIELWEKLSYDNLLISDYVMMTLCVGMHIIAIHLPVRQAIVFHSVWNGFMTSFITTEP